VRYVVRRGVHVRPVVTMSEGEQVMSGVTAERQYRNRAGVVYAVALRLEGGQGITVNPATRAVSAADPEVWAAPEKFGLVRWFCPGHLGAPCQYGMHDEVRYAGPVPAVTLPPYRAYDVACECGGRFASESDRDGHVGRTGCRLVRTS
jgi:hypothetical protein